MSLDATVAGTAADSYLTVATADAFAADDLGPEATGWTPAVTASKEAALKRATREIGAYLRTGWPPYAVTQALLFPRSVDVSGTTPFIPNSIKRACYEQATYVLRNASVLDAANTRRARNMANASEPNASYSQPGALDAASVLSAQALHYLAAFPVAALSYKAGTVTSPRVTSGFVGGV